MTVTDKMVERVAAAISEAAWDEMRRQGFSGGWDHDELGKALARAAIAALPDTAELERLREALEPFAAHVATCRSAFPNDPVSAGGVCRNSVSFSDFERALAALTGSNGGGDKGDNHDRA